MFRRITGGLPPLSSGGWHLFEDPNRFVADLLATRAADDWIVDREVGRILWRMRLWGRWNEIVSKLRSAWIYGKHWRARSKVHGGATSAPSGGPGGTITSVSITGAGAGYAGVLTFAPPSPRAFEDAGIRAGEVTAFRAWRLGSDGLLHSCYQEAFVWHPGEVAEGDSSKECEGIHAFKEKLDVQTYLDEWKIYLKLFPLPVFVTGTVDLWGDVYEHERGYRASRAKIASIDDSPIYDAPALRRLYGLDP